MSSITVEEIVTNLEQHWNQLLAARKQAAIEYDLQVMRAEARKVRAGASILGIPQLKDVDKKPVRDLVVQTERKS